MSHKEGLSTPAAPRAWTRPDDYLGAMARKRTARRSRQGKGRTQPEAPQAILSTIPFLALMAALALLTIGIAIAAFPGSQPLEKPRVTAKEKGTAARGWLQDAQKEMHPQSR